MIRIRCYKVNGHVQDISYLDFIDLYNNKKKAQQDWQHCKEQIQRNPKRVGEGALYKFVKDKDNVFYFTHSLTKEQLKSIVNLTPKIDDLPSINTRYEVDKETFNKELNCFVKEIYPAKELINGPLGDYILQNKDLSKNKKKYVLLDGDEIKVTSDRLRLFKTKGLKCVSCSLEGQYFYKCRRDPEINYFLELIAEKDGKLVNMTKDHILPLSKGGSPRNLNNLQVMCSTCNKQKGNNLNIKDAWNGVTDEEIYLYKLEEIRRLCTKEYNTKKDKQTLCNEIINIIKTQSNSINKKSILSRIKKLIKGS